ncbi:MAG: ABC transporter permease [Clostridia bacterium]|jgi:spermidine/putrescine transport system permease protein|nr:ABC transporter permease [Clostridia bacterium]
MKKSTNALLNAPYAVWSAIFVVVPLFIVIVYAFTDAEGHFSFDSILALKDYGHNFLISLLYSLVATVITLIIAYPFAYALSKTNEKTQRIQMMLVMLPMWMNLLIRTYSWMNILDQNGIINQLLMTLGLKPATFLGTPGAVIFGMVYNYLPYMILPIYTVMAKMDNSLVEAARDLGCNGFNVWRRLILPLSMPGVISGITMVFVPSVSTFYISQKLGNGKIMLIGDTIERQMQTLNNYNLGAALSLVLMVLILVSMFIMNRFADNSGEGGLVA